MNQLLKKNYSLHFQNMCCTIVDHDSSELMVVKMRDKSFQIKWKKTNIHANTTIIDELVLWHKRFGHFNYTAHKHLYDILSQSFLVLHDQRNVYQICQFGKQNRLPYPVNKAWRVFERRQLIHADVCGPMKTPSPKWSNYFKERKSSFHKICTLKGSKSTLR